jgi:hypothetical protein
MARKRRREDLVLKSLTLDVRLPAGLGDAWGAAPPPANPRESCIKELGSHLLQVEYRSWPVGSKAVVEL